MRAFVSFPWRIYRRFPQWVPSLRRDVSTLLDPSRHPFYSHAEREIFLAWRNGEPIGRVAAIRDRAYTALHGEAVGFFGFFEATSPDAAEALIRAARAWLGERGMTRIRGPVNPSLNETGGCLVKGFETPPMILMPYNPPHYPAYLEACGLKKAKDLLAYLFELGEEVPEWLERVADRVARREPGFRVRPVALDRFGEELDRVRLIYNEAWRDNWGFVPMTEAEIADMAERLKPLIVPELALFVELKGEPIAFVLGLPDYHQALRCLNGRLTPWGIARAYWRTRRIRDVRFLVMGIREPYRKRGSDILLYRQGYRNALARGYRRVEISWILEDNALIRRGVERFAGEPHKVYRVYEGNL